MKRLTLFLVFLAIPVFGETPPEPRIVERDGRPALDLPEKLYEELAKQAPQFHKFSDSDYIPEIVESLPTLREQGVQLLSSVVGDFDGNGLADVVMNGHIADKLTLVLILTKADGYEFHINEYGPFNPYTWLGVGGNQRQYGFWGYMRKVPRGEITSPYEQHPLRLEGDAIEHVAWGKAAVLTYWKDGEWKRYITSD